MVAASAAAIIDTLRFNEFNVQLLFQFAIKEYIQILIAYYLGHIFHHFPIRIPIPRQSACPATCSSTVLWFSLMFRQLLIFAH